MPYIDSDLMIKCLQPKNQEINKTARKILSWLFKNNSEVKTTIYNFAELFRGAYLSKRVAHNMSLVEKFISRFTIVFPTYNSVKEYARISANLQIKGEKIGDLDELIASIIVDDEDVLYTRNIQHFERVPLINLVNWENLGI
jgi:predicted nucleic acid-binding protein